MRGTGFQILTLADVVPAGLLRIILVCSMEAAPVPSRTLGRARSGSASLGSRGAPAACSASSASRTLSAIPGATSPFALLARTASTSSSTDRYISAPMKSSKMRLPPKQGRSTTATVNLGRNSPGGGADGATVSLGRRCMHSSNVALSTSLRARCRRNVSEPGQPEGAADGPGAPAAPRRPLLGSTGEPVGVRLRLEDFRARGCVSCPQTRPVAAVKTGDHGLRSCYSLSRGRARPEGTFLTTRPDRACQHRRSGRRRTAARR
jgi:hypothetical protein